MLVKSDSELFNITSKAYLGLDVFNYDYLDKFNDRETLEKCRRSVMNKDARFDVILYNYATSARIARENFRKYASKNKINRNKNYIFLYTQNKLSYYKDIDNQKTLLRFLDSDDDSFLLKNANFYFLDKKDFSDAGDSYFFLKTTNNHIDLRDLYDKDMFVNNNLFWIESEVFSKFSDDNEIMYELYPEYRVLIQNDNVCLTDSQEKYFRSKGFSPLSIKDLNSIDFPLIDLFLSIKYKKKHSSFFKRHKDIGSFNKSLYDFLLTTKNPSIEMIERYELIIIKKFGKDYKEKYLKVRKSLNNALIANIRKGNKIEGMFRELGIKKDTDFDKE